MSDRIRAVIIEDVRGCTQYQGEILQPDSAASHGAHQTQSCCSHFVGNFFNIYLIASAAKATLGSSWIAQ